ncbi:UBX domain-containing protein 4 [Chaetomidium leptoderma]|uniref:UBX domain-containing protein 2 n=1 Tax=Chaetomidium leptoderma TaxID=669021 RepID=A0AAN6VI22_9PEZI|nr:UBX domain-containing protein 4 [Chaetomidium leptoderma]
MTFFQGSLQEGIAAALQQGKSVVCFVTDGETESQQWEDEFFAEEQIRLLLQAQAVPLRLEAGSQEEGFLAQLYPIPKKPTVVIIKNAELKEYIASGVSRDEFMRRMELALAGAQPVPSQALPPQSVPRQPEPMATPAASTNQLSHAEESSASSSGQATPPSPAGSRVQSLLAERASVLAATKKRDEDEAKRQRAEKGKAKAEAEASGLKKPDDQSKHIAAVKKKQRDAREERERILKAIDDDKAARKAQKAEAEAARKAAAASEKSDSASVAPASHVLPPSTGRLSEHCAIQVRLFDGSTIRKRFSSNETLKDVRNWVNETRDGGKVAYVFKVLLTPLPSRTIDVTEEDKSLQALELAPSSTLILLRVPKYTAAYSSSSSSSSSSSRAAASGSQGNVFQRLIAYVLAIITGFFSTISAFFSTFFSTAGAPAAPDSATPRTSQSQTAADAARRRGRQIAGMDHAEGRRNDQQFYNGNSTNFEPRTDDGE